jgi:signal transduction histidine kinase
LPLLIPAIPTISTTVGVTFAQGMLVVGVFFGVVALAFLTFYRFGAASRLYRFFDYLEGFTLSWCIAYLIQSSRSVHSFFWIFHGIQVFATSFAGYSLLYMATVCVGPAYLAAVFLSQGQTASAWLSALAGVSGLFVYLLVARLSSERDAALRREAELRHELGQRLVARERERISRDLHDNVATELTALVWKVREISDVAPSGPNNFELPAVAERLRSVIADLRNVVLALRKPELSFPELELLVEQRCRELCGHANLRLEMHGRVEVEELKLFHDEILPICFELVSNAALHAKAGHIELELRIESRLQILVSDDGCGLAPELWQASGGGLHGVRQRVQQLGGGVTLETAAIGTRLVVDLPRPLRSMLRFR